VFLVQTGASPLCFGFASLAHIVTFLGLGLIVLLNSFQFLEPEPNLPISHDFLPVMGLLIK
jgi:hypothetical protein